MTEYNHHATRNARVLHPQTAGVVTTSPSSTCRPTTLTL